MSEKTIKVFNPRVILREGAGALLEAAADPASMVILRAGRMWSPLPPVDGVPVKRPMVRVDTKHGSMAYGDAGTRVYRLVEVTDEEIPALQAQLDRQNGFDIETNNG